MGGNSPDAALCPKPLSCDVEPMTVLAPLYMVEGEKGHWKREPSLVSCVGRQSAKGCITIPGQVQECTSGYTGGRMH